MNNLSGINIARIRKEANPTLSQRALADKLQLYGIDVDKNAIQRIECGKRVEVHFDNFISASLSTKTFWLQ